MSDFLISGGRSYEVELVWEMDVSDEEDMLPHYIYGGYCKCFAAVEATFKFCSNCGEQLYFVPFKEIKTDLTEKQYLFLKHHTNMNKFDIAKTTKAEGIIIIGKVMDTWKKRRDANMDDWDNWIWDCYEEPF